MATVAMRPEEFAATLPRHVVSAGVLLTDPAGRILMLHQAHGYPGHPAWWQLPGGLADAGEQPNVTAVRETHEETGILLPSALPLLAVDYRSPADGWPAVIDFCFDAGTVTAADEVDVAEVTALTDAAESVAARALAVVLSAEHDDFAWREYEQWQPCLQPEQRPWFAAVWRARTSGTALFLNDGR
ncbi:NUDIX domain-containing protein [Kitasatospora kifunensis]|uniref:8-oxo-dGTP pyrophosphatase MutT (NUDIX family) n=1 Tax=Kitasatospora kifunensis TaxID=58351 RepID=A0A7W7VT56_KITKI|nr:NUDIX hydrolase [Kitasatospora kifunensis]MBB4921329.1 8-oxo-dGTP pyrophosphatase MutT (NUDIX family) [Kitasatospora kifunensis]